MNLQQIKDLVFHLIPGKVETLVNFMKGEHNYEGE